MIDEFLIQHLSNISNIYGRYKLSHIYVYYPYRCEINATLIITITCLIFRLGAVLLIISNL